MKVLYIWFTSDSLISVALKGDSGSNMNYLKVYCAIGTAYISVFSCWKDLLAGM